MIFDKVSNCEKYFVANDKYEKAFEFIKKAVEEDLPDGKYEIIGDDLFASVQSYTTRKNEDCKFEGHRRYIDIQYMVSGIEAIEVVDIEKTKSNVGYSEENDVDFFENTDKACKLVIESGDYGIFLPNDIHKPGIAFESPMPIKKIVVKIKI